jgi:hypothetical protein
MPKVTINADGVICAAKNKAEITVYYAEQIEKRLQAMLMLQGLGADDTAICSKIQQLNTERKQKLAEVD